MTKASIFFISFCILLLNCGNPEAAKTNIEQDDLSNVKAALAKLNDVLKKYEEPSQIFNVVADRVTVLKGRSGTKITINPDNLVTESGKPPGKNIEVELKELTNQEQLLRTNAQTVSDGRLLVSGGAYYIGMTSNGERLKLKEGKTLSVQFPKLSDNEMSLFYGQRNESGRMNWQKATETFKSVKRSTVAIDSTGTVRIGRKSDMEAILDYVDSGRKAMTQEEKKAMLERRANYKISEKVYDEIGVAKLGWINCDRFLEVENKTDLYAGFNPQDSVKNGNVYLVFKDINSVVQADYYSNKYPQFNDMPIGYKARLIAYTVKDEKVFAYSSDLTIAKGQKLVLNLKEITDQDFKKLISN